MRGDSQQDTSKGRIMFTMVKHWYVDATGLHHLLLSSTVSDQVNAVSCLPDLEGKVLKNRELGKFFKVCISKYVFNSIYLEPSYMPGTVQVQGVPW